MAFPQQPIPPPIDTLGIATQQHAAPTDAQAAFDRAFATVSTDLGVTLDALAAQNLIDLVAPTAAIGPVDSTQLGVQAPINLDTSNPRA